MKKGNSGPLAMVVMIAAIVLICNAPDAAAGIKEGLALCMQVVVPALFPFIFLSILLNSALIGRKIPFLQPLCRLCGIPDGCEGLLLIGMIGGYPVGAQNIHLAYQCGTLHRNTANRLLGFFNNAGPAFIFGMLSPLFTNPGAPWLLWLLHMGCALVVGFLLPGKAHSATPRQKLPPLTVTAALEKSLKAIAMICGWVILFRAFLYMLNQWILQKLPVVLQALFTGFLELTNGCCLLSRIPNECERFIVAAVLLAQGGLCITMQTASAIGELSLESYLPGKCLQTVISLLLSLPVASILYRRPIVTASTMGLFMVCLLMLSLFLYFLRPKKVVAFRNKMVYNNTKR